MSTNIPKQTVEDGLVIPAWPIEVIRTHRIYFIGPGEDGPVKVGFSTDVESRLKQLQTAAPFKLRLLAQIVGTKDLEAEIHRRLTARGYHLHGEWFQIDADQVAAIIVDLFEDGLVWS